MSLPPDATLHSHALFPLAREMTDACPPELGSEIALAGSVARGWADEHSDIELNFWLETLD
jgi:predicted nucleotidyltransferase